MLHFWETVKERNNILFLFGVCNGLAALVLMVLLCFSDRTIGGSNAWLKPLKFALSIGVFAWTMGWYGAELIHQQPVRLYSWVVVVTLGFEITYISLQAARGQLSHYNISSPLYSGLTMLMGIAALIVTGWTAYIGLLFFTNDVRPLPAYYLWSIRFGILFFVVFAFQGALMGARFTHVVGGSANGKGIPLLGWSLEHGDLRIAHFVGMHALQLLPLAAWYVLRNTRATLGLVLVYGLIALFTLWQALSGLPLTAWRQPRKLPIVEQ